jgi:hypothetical protein
MKSIATLFCSSRETNQVLFQQSNQSTFSSNLDVAITTEHSHEELYLALKSFTFTNMFYNSLKAFRLRFGLDYSSYQNTVSKRYIEEYVMNEGNFDVFGFQSEYTTYLLGSRNLTPPKNVFSNTDLGLSASPESKKVSMPTTFQRMVFNENNRKLSFELDAFTLTYKTSEITPNTIPCIPRRLLIEMQNDTEEIYDYWGIFRPGDSSVYFEGRRFIEIPLTFTISTKEVTNVQYTQFIFSKVVYECNWPVYLRTVDYIDVMCENVQATNYSSNSAKLSLSSVLARIPVLSDFGQTQTVSIQVLDYIPIQQSQLNSIRIQLSNNDNLINMQKTCFLCELCVSLKAMPDISVMKGSVDNERYLPPLLASNLGIQDKLDYAQSQPMTRLQEKVLGTNKRGRNPY